MSGKRRWIGIATALLLLLVLMVYRYVTDAERLRAYAESWLEDFSGGEVHVKRVDFDLFRGLNLIGVTIAVPESAQFNPEDNSLDARTLFRCASVFFQLRPLSLLSGHLAVPEITALHPELKLVHRSADGVGNWQTMLRKRVPEDQDPWSFTPSIRLRDVLVSEFRLERDGTLVGGSQIIWADAIPSPAEGEHYRLEITKFYETESDAGVRGATGVVEVDMDTLAVSGRLPWMSMEDLLFSAPESVSRWLDILALKGELSSDNFSYAPGGEGSASLTLRHASIAVPLGEEDRALPPSQRYLRFENVQGVCTFAHREAKLRLEGAFHGRPVKLEGTMTLPEKGMSFDDLGFDMHVLADRIRLPRNDSGADPSELRFVNKWKLFRDFVEDFDPRGQATLNAKLHKAPGAEHGIEFVEATLEVHEISAAYRKFPYRVEQLSGIVHWRPDRKIELRDIEGRRGDAIVRVQGLHQGYGTTGMEVAIHGEKVALDDYLLAQLAAPDRELVEQFNADARMDIAIQIHRDNLPAGTPNNPALADIDVTFLDGTMRFEPFPYPFDRLSGKLLIRGRSYEFVDFTGRREEAMVVINGRAERGRKSGIDFDLQLEAEAIPLDETLEAALPDQARLAYARVTPSGRADVSGKIQSNEGTPSFIYQLDTQLRDLEVSISEPKMHLVEGKARMRLSPNRIEVPEFHCRLGASPLIANGWMHHGSGPPVFELKVASPKLRLEPRVYEALPGAVRAVWDEFAPRGEVKFDFELSNRTATNRPAGRVETSPSRQETTTTSPADGNGPDWNYDYRVRIEPLGAGLTYARFPLPLTSVSGQILAVPGQIQLSDVKATHENARLTLSGDVRYQPGGIDTSLKIRAADLSFSEALRQAVPWRLRRMWNDLEPQGAFDLDLQKLHIQTRQDQRALTELVGRATLRGVALDLGIPLTDAHGILEGRMVWEDTTAMNVDIKFDRASLSGRTLTDARARLEERTGTQKLLLNDVQAGFYGGTLRGDMEIARRSAGSRYGINMLMENVSLAEFLNAKRAPDEPRSQLKGLIDGNLAVAGRFGRPQSRRGGGAITIRRAELFKIPLILSILQVIHFAIDDDNAIHDASTRFAFDGEHLILQEIDMRGKALSMMGAGRVHTARQEMDIVLLVGSPLELPRVEILSDLVEGLARELMEVHVEGQVSDPQIRADIVRSVRATLETILNLRRPTETEKVGP